MNIYIEYLLQDVTSEQADILVGELAELDFESFTEYDEVERSIACYVQAELEQSKKITSLLKDVQFVRNEIEQQNWNEIWESNFEPINVEGRCYIRATFHEPYAGEGLDHEIIITPKMSFGTGHHPTTYLVVKLMLDEPFEDLSILDMGSGTAVLAILAAMKGASSVDAIDIDEWAYDNAKENIALNSVKHLVNPLLGDASAINNQYDTILANINRNILLRDMPIYISSLKTDGTLMVSGILKIDEQDIIDRAVELGLKHIKSIEKDGWMAIKFIK